MAKVLSKDNSSDHSRNTLFVSTLPYNATSDDLVSFFSEIGPIRSCFVVAPKPISNESPSEITQDKPEEKRNNNGCGYVQFALAADAERALKELKKKKFMNKRILKMEFSLKKKIASKAKGNLFLF